MPRVRERSRARWLSRICLACGYDGPEIQRGDEGDVFVCPCCGDDLYARRPRSYAEMEGFVASSRLSRVEAVAEPVLPAYAHAGARLGWWRRALAWLGLSLTRRGIG